MDELLFDENHLSNMSASWHVDASSLCVDVAVVDSCCRFNLYFVDYSCLEHLHPDSVQELTTTSVATHT